MNSYFEKRIQDLTRGPLGKWGYTLSKDEEKHKDIQYNYYRFNTDRLQLCISYADRLSSRFPDLPNHIELDLTQKDPNRPEDRGRFKYLNLLQYGINFGLPIGKVGGKRSPEIPFESFAAAFFDTLEYAIPTYLSDFLHGKAWASGYRERTEEEKQQEALKVEKIRKAFDRLMPTLASLGYEKPEETVELDAEGNYYTFLFYNFTRRLELTILFTAREGIISRWRATPGTDGFAVFLERPNRFNKIWPQKSLQSSEKMDTMFISQYSQYTGLPLHFKEKNRGNAPFDSFLEELLKELEAGIQGYLREFLDGSKFVEATHPRDM